MSGHLERLGEGLGLPGEGDREGNNGRGDELEQDDEPDGGGDVGVGPESCEEPAGEGEEGREKGVREAEGEEVLSGHGRPFRAFGAAGFFAGVEAAHEPAREPAAGRPV